MASILPNGMSQGDLVQFLTNTVALVNELKTNYNINLNQSLSAGGLAEGTNSATIKTTATVPFVINGVFYSYSATDNIAITACTQQAISTYCLYLVSINAAGTVTVTQGTSVATDTAVLPALPAASAPLGYYKIATDSSHTYTAGTTDHSAAGITDTYFDLATVNSGASARPAIVSPSLSLTI